MVARPKQTIFRASADKLHIHKASIDAFISFNVNDDQAECHSIVPQPRHRPGFEGPQGSLAI